MKVMAATLLALAAHGVADADQVVLNPTKDNTIYQPLFSENSNGAGDSLYSGVSRDGLEKRALLMFDLTSAIPAGSTITAVTVSIKLTKSSTLASAGSLHRLAADWGEGTSDAGTPGGQGTAPDPGDATWNYAFFQTTPWSTPGGEFVASASATITLNALGFYTWPSTPALVGDVQRWADDAGSNAGWILICPASGGFSSARQFASREAFLAADRPTLTVTFDPPGCPCIADFDASGGTPDSGDIDAFFAAWLTGDPATDADCSGGTPDSGDIDVFFSQWLAGGC